MQCVANYEVRAEGSIFEDDRVLRIQHPRGVYRARIRNIPRSTFDKPFLLSLHLYFDAPSLKEARDVADEHMVECMNMLAFTTGLDFRRHRIRLVAEATPQEGMRSMRLWSDTLQYEDPQPLLSEEIARTIEVLLRFDVPPAIRRALRWFRLGVDAAAADDQFMNFWFALEIMAEFQKATEKVPDRCVVCRSPLYCETCKTHTTHKPYAKQAIGELLKRVDDKCDDAVVDRLDLARNRLMHGATLKEINESGDPPAQNKEHVVNVLGRLVWRALLFQFPRDLINGKLEFLLPSTYLHHTLDAVALIQTVAKTNADGDLDLDALLQNMKSEMVTVAPPQSARPTAIAMTQPQFEQIQKFAYGKASDYQIICNRVLQTTETVDSKLYAVIFATDMPTIRSAMDSNDQQEWVNLFRQILAAPLPH